MDSRWWWRAAILALLVAFFLLLAKTAVLAFQSDSGRMASVDRLVNPPHDQIARPQPPP